MTVSGFLMPHNIGRTCRGSILAAKVNSTCRGKNGVVVRLSSGGRLCLLVTLWRAESKRLWLPIWAWDEGHV